MATRPIERNAKNI